MSATSSSSALFTGSSLFSNDLQQVVQRAVAFASLPMQQMQNDLTSLQSQQSAASTLSTDFTALQSAVTGIESAISGAAAYTVSVGTTAVASAAIAAGAMPGTYSLNVIGTGRFATSMSSDGLPAVTDPGETSISDAGSYTLSVGTKSYTITPKGSTLSDLTQALNTSGYVQATLVNIGGSDTPNYRLSLQGTLLGDLPIQLTAIDGSNPGQTLLTAQTPPGAAAEYQVNGQPAAHIFSNTASVSIAPGLSVTLLSTGVTTVTVSPSTNALVKALGQFATAYNAAMADVNKNRGNGGGALAGQSLVLTLAQALRGITGYSTGNGGLSSLTSLGFSFDQSGVLSFDLSAFTNATSGQSGQLASFLGSSTTGGFLKAAADALEGVEDSSSGVLTQQLSSLASQITAKNDAIGAQQDRITRLQTSLNQQMSAADSAIAAMEQQLQSLQGYFQAMSDAQKAYG
jgi:flagellar hook-associated protein 2